MSELIDRQAAIDMIEKYFDGLPIAVHYDMLAMIHRLPSVQPDRELIEQLKWERDTAIQQLKDLGYGLGEKPRTDDTISRQEAIATAVRAAIDWHRLANPQYSIAYCIGEAMRSLPSEQTDRTALHELLQDAVDAGIITETQASRLMDMINDSEDNT